MNKADLLLRAYYEALYERLDAKKDVLTERIGELLTEQKAGMKHGNWLPWIKENLPFSERTARDYLRFYDRREELKTARVADMAEARKFLEVPKQHAFKQGMSLLERMKITPPSTKFRVIHADPPYDEFTIEDLKTVPVKECADRDSVLFIWATNHQEDFTRMFELIETWGFQYRTSYWWAWVEDPPEGSEEKPRIVKDVTWEAVPFLFRTVVEPCFIATILSQEKTTSSDVSSLPS